MIFEFLIEKIIESVFSSNIIDWIKLSKNSYNSECIKYRNKHRINTILGIYLYTN